VTHAHVDHAGSPAELLEHCDATTLVHEFDAPFVRSGRNPPFPDPRSLGWLDRAVGRMALRAAAPARVDREVGHDEGLDEVAPGARVVHLPGHTPGQAGVWLPDRRFLIGGDVALHVLPGRLSLPFAAFTSDMRQAIGSVGRAADLRPLGLGVGHGPPLRGDAETRLRRLARRHGARLNADASTPPEVGGDANAGAPTGRPRS
jgi:glyoxylase-like metal-dependent hydrolase (beta-lactamase superfamily II)